MNKKAGGNTRFPLSPTYKIISTLKMYTVFQYNCYKQGLYNNFYVYAYLDITKSGTYNYDKYTFEYQPFYIGKGIRKRFLYHIREALGLTPIRERTNFLKLYKIKKIIKETGHNPSIIIIEKNLPDKKAIEIEKRLINLIGRKNTVNGPLVNMVEGGVGTSGLRMSDSAKEKLRKIRTGTKASIETRRKMSESQKGKRHSLNSINKMRKVQKGHSVSKKTKEKLRSINLGKNVSEETKEKMSISHLKKKFKHSKRSCDLMSKNLSTYIYKAISPEGIVYDEIYSLNKFVHNLNFNRRTVLRYIKNNKKYKNWNFSRRMKCDQR